MDVVISQEPDGAARSAAECVIEAMRANPRLVLGVATGSSPLGIYRYVREAIEQGRVDASEIACFALDEYVGLPLNHPESYHAVLRRTVTEPWGLRETQMHVPDGFAENPVEAAHVYERTIRGVGGIDLQILGIGANGHVGFNEPGSSLASRTRVKTLHPRTREDNARFFEGDETSVPVHCVTQGIGTILDSRRAVLIASGEAKAEAIAAMVEGPVSSSCPASALQMHPHVQVHIDSAAAAGLRHREYYEFVRAQLGAVPASAFDDWR